MSTYSSDEVSSRIFYDQNVAVSRPSPGPRRESTERYVSHERTGPGSSTSTPRREFAARHEALSHQEWSENDFQSDRRRQVDNRLLAYRQDLAEWFQQLFDMNITEKSFIDDIDTGVLLCRLALLVDQAEAEQGSPVNMRSAIRFNKKAQKGDFVARDNVACFIAWARSLGVDSSVVFETDDLVERKNEKHVLYCLMEIGRVQRGLPPPKLVQIERMLDSGQSHVQTRDDQQQIAAAIRDTLDRQRLSGSIRIERNSNDMYIINGQGPFSLVLLRQFLMIRVGRHWDTFDNFLHTLPSRSASQAPSVTESSQTPLSLSRSGSQGSLARSHTSQQQQQQFFQQQQQFVSPQSVPLQQQFLSPRGSAQQLLVNTSSSNNINNTAASTTSSQRGSSHRLLSSSRASQQQLFTSPLKDRSFVADGVPADHVLREQLEAHYSRRIADLEQELANSRAEVEMQGRRLSDHHSSLSDAERQALILRTRADCANEVHSLKSTIQELQAQLELRHGGGGSSASLNNSLNHSRSQQIEIEQLREEVQRLREERATMQTQTQTRDFAPQIVYKRSTEDEEAIANLEKELLRLQEELSLNTQEIAEQNRQITAQDQALRDMQADHERDKASWLAAQQAALDEHVRTLREELETARRAFTQERASHDATVAEQRELIERLTKSNKVMNEQDAARMAMIESLQKTVQDLTLQIRAHEMRANEMDDVSKDLESRRETLSRDKKSLEARITSLEAELKAAQAENTRLREELEALRAKYEATHATAEAMEARVRELEPRLQAATDAHANCDVRIAELEATVAALEKQLEEQIGAGALLANDKEMLLLEKEKLLLAHTSEREALTDNLTTQHTAAVDELNKALRALQAAADEQRTSDADLIAQLRARIKELEEQLAALQERLRALEAEQEADRLRAQEEKDRADQRLRELEEARLAEEARLKREHDEQTRLRAEQAAAEQRAREEEEAKRLAEAKRQADEAQAKLRELEEAERARLAEIERKRLEEEEKARLAEEERLRQLELKKKQEEEARLKREAEEREAIARAQREEEERINSAETQRELRELAPVMRDVTEWINVALNLDPHIKPDNLLASLATGELLCELAAAIDDAEDTCRGAESEGRELDAEGYDTVVPEGKGGPRTRPSVSSKPTTAKPAAAKPGVAKPGAAGAAKKGPPKKLGWNYTPPVGVSRLRDYIRGRTLLPPNFTRGVARGTDAARKNIANFVEWMQRLGLKNALSVDDVAKVNRNPRRVLYALLDIARRTRRFPLPSMIWMERRASYTYEADPKDEVDKAVKDIFLECLCHPPIFVRRVSPGEYSFGPDSKPHLIRVVGKSINVRVGGGWDTLRNFLLTHDPCRENQQVQDAAKAYSTALATHKKPPAKKYVDSLGQPMGFLSTLSDSCAIVE
eukprot:m.167060 g.167060  ORF g.167060 m.167060 type:complete len:1410 (-) comp17186_c2_seq2:291-4520(-)